MKPLLAVVCCFVAIVVWWMNYSVFGTSSFDSKVWFAHQTDKMMLLVTEVVWQKILKIVCLILK